MRRRTTMVTMNRWQREADEKIDLLNSILADPEAKSGMIGFIVSFGSPWNHSELEKILQTERGEEFSEVPRLKAFFIFERLRELCINIIQEIAEQPE
jgi:hypothetical protein